jgi:hypothetical protein
MAAKRTQEQIKMEWYVTRQGRLCPACNSDELEYETADDSYAAQITQVAHCRKCDSNWTDVYKLTGYRDFLNMPESLGKEVTDDPFDQLVTDKEVDNDE